MNPYYESGGIRLFHSDFRDVPPQDDLNVDVLLTDPPYSSDSGFGGASQGSIGRRNHGSIAGDGMPVAGYVQLMMDAIKYTARDAGYVLMFTNWRMVSHTQKAIERSGFQYRGMMVWVKNNRGMGKPFAHQHELCLYGCKRYRTLQHDEDHKFDTQYPSDVFQEARIPTKDRLHPTEKPIPLLVKMLMTTPQNAAVVDPFCGSGTSLIAAKMSNRPGWGCDVDERYLESAAKRLEETLMIEHQQEKMW